MSESFFEQFRIGEFARENLLFVSIFLIGVIFLFVGIFQYFGNRPGNVVLDENVLEQDEENEVPIFVDVSGAVVAPGVYQLVLGDRVQDAVVASGGILEDADKQYLDRDLNMAREVIDGEKIYIPFEHDDVLGSESENSETSSLVNINTASLSELDTLPRVGPVTAQKIIDNRPYQSLDSLLTKEVIGESTFNDIKNSIRIY